MILTPFPEYPLCARSFNNFHLALMLRMIKTVHDGLRYPKGYTHKPACALWKDTPQQLLMYGCFLAKEATDRKLPDPRDWSWIHDEYMFRGTESPAPFWLGNKEWHSYHRGLMHKADELFYTAMFLKVGVGIRFDVMPDIFAMTGYAKERLIAEHVNKIMFGRLHVDAT